jgi:osmotically-inducible protein OsmY
VLERVESQLRRNSYVALKNISCAFQDGVVTLRGCLPSYYLKQMAQTAVARVPGVDRIVNQIDVVSPNLRGPVPV